MKRLEYANGDRIGMVANGCDGCNPSVINGTLCHESGCPDSWRDYTRDCLECGNEFYPNSRCHSRVCDDCMNPVELED